MLAAPRKDKTPRGVNMIKVVQAFDRKEITEFSGDDGAALEAKFETARKLFADRKAWLKPPSVPTGCRSRAAACPVMASAAFPTRCTR
jgi:hypothetical protein